MVKNIDNFYTDTDCFSNPIEIDDILELTDKNILTYYLRCIYPYVSTFSISSFKYDVKYEEYKNRLQKQIRKEKLTKLLNI